MYRYLRDTRNAQPRDVTNIASIIVDAKYARQFVTILYITSRYIVAVR